MNVRYSDNSVMSIIGHNNDEFYRLNQLFFISL